MRIAANTTSFDKAVKITRSGEVGTITGFARHKRSKEPQFSVEYRDALGAARTDWFHQSELSLVE